MKLSRPISHLSLSRLFFAFTITVSVVLGSIPIPVFADTLDTMNISLSDVNAKKTGVTHTINFTTKTTSDLQEIQLRWATNSGGVTKPSYLDLTSSTLGSTTGIGADWSLDTTNVNTGLLALTRATPISISASQAVSIPIDSITNQAIGDCTDPLVDLSDTCYIQIRTFSDAGGTAVDVGFTTYTVTEAPYFTIKVEGVGTGETHNGITTSVTSTPNSLPFGKLAAGDVRYAAHKITVRTNAIHGYKVDMYVDENMKGNYNTGIISPFAATDAYWQTPQAWETPSGTISNSNTGWFGANTSDTRVTGWENGSAKFGPVNVINHIVMYSDTWEISDKVIYVSYALGINAAQPADSYTGNVFYNVKAKY